MRVGRYNVNPIDAILAVLVPITAFGLYAEFHDRTTPQDVIQAAREGDIATVKQYVGESFDFLARDDRGRTIVHAAAESGDSDIVVHVLRMGGGVAFGAFDRNGHTPVHLSLGIFTPFGRVETPTIKAFIDYGADPNLENQMGEPLLVSAIEARQERSAYRLLKYGADVDVGLVGGRPLVTTVTANGMTELLSKVLHKGGSANPDAPGNSPLAYAISRKNSQAVRLLLGHGADPNKKLETEWLSTDPMDSDGSYATWHQPDGTVLWGPILTSSSRTPTHPMRMTPLDFALMRDLDCANALIEHGSRAELFPRILTRALCW